MATASNREGDMILKGKVEVLMAEFQKPRKVKNISILGENSYFENMIIS